MCASTRAWTPGTEGKTSPSRGAATPRGAEMCRRSAARRPFPCAVLGLTPQATLFRRSAASKSRTASLRAPYTHGRRGEKSPHPRPLSQRTRGECRTATLWTRPSPPAPLRLADWRALPSAPRSRSRQGRKELPCRDSLAAGQPQGSISARWTCLPNGDAAERSRDLPKSLATQDLRQRLDGFLAVHRSRTLPNDLMQRGGGGRWNEA